MNFVPTCAFLSLHCTRMTFYYTLIFFLILYTAIIEPMRISYWNFEEGNKLELFFIIIAILIDVVFAVDIFINFFAAYVRPDGSLDY